MFCGFPPSDRRHSSLPAVRSQLLHRQLVDFVMAGLVSAINVFGGPSKVVDGRDKPGHDGVGGQLA